MYKNIITVVTKKHFQGEKLTMGFVLFVGHPVQSNVVTGYDVRLTFDHFRVLGITTEVSSVSVNGNFIDTFTVDPSSGVRALENINL